MYVSSLLHSQTESSTPMFLHNDVILAVTLWYNTIPHKITTDWTLALEGCCCTLSLLRLVVVDMKWLMQGSIDVHIGSNNL